MLSTPTLMTRSATTSITIALFARFRLRRGQSPAAFPTQTSTMAHLLGARRYLPLAARRHLTTAGADDARGGSSMFRGERRRALPHGGVNPRTAPAATLFAGIIHRYYTRSSRPGSGGVIKLNGNRWQVSHGSATSLTVCRTSTHRATCEQRRTLTRGGNNMSYNLADIKYISAPTLRLWFDQGLPNGTFAVVDVRDLDYVGGHIRGCLHYPAAEFEARLPELQQELLDRGVTDVVFHCALSQVRGPLCTLKFLRANAAGSDDRLKVLRVFVLKGGFTRWQQEYGEDEAVTEDYDKQIWLADF